MLFSGKDNSISLRREYYKDYACEFDLRFYPFDTQMCVMIFEVKGKTDDYVQLKKDGYGVEFLCNTFNKLHSFFIQNHSLIL